MQSAPDEERVAGSEQELREKGYLALRTRHGVVCVIERDGALFAFDDACTHMGSDLHRGKVEDGAIVCPWHGARFEIATGKSLDRYATDICTYPVEIVDGSVVVRLARGGSEPKGPVEDR